MNTSPTKNAQYSLFHNSCIFYYVIVDIAGKLEYSNPFFRDQFMKKESGFIDKKLASFFPDHLAGQLYDMFQQCRDDPGISKHIDLVILANPENRHISRWEFTAITNNNDRTVDIHGLGYVLPNNDNDIRNGKNNTGTSFPDQLVQEMTVKDELLKSELFYRNLFADSLDGVLITNENGLIYFASASVISILGYNIEELIGTKAFDHVHPDDRELAISAFMDEVKQKPKHKFISIRLKKQNGEWLYCIIRGHNLMHNPYVNGMVIYFYDDTLRKETEAALLQSEKRFSDLSRELVEQEINKQKLLTQATIDGQEKERLEMGKELHDNINQHLNTTRLYLEVAREKSTGSVKEMIEFSHKSLAGIIDKIRALSQSLVPPTLGDIGLVESIQDICDSLKRTHKFKIHFFYRHFNEEGVPENMRLMLFRITQEQVNNIIRHSEASIIQIKLESDAEYINLTIDDNGKGFDPANFKKGLGITNIMNRASLFNGIIEIEAAKGKGCRLSVNIPLKSGPDE